MTGSKRAFHPQGIKDMASRKRIQSITGMWAVSSTAAGLLFVGSPVASAESLEPKGSVSRYSHGNSRESLACPGCRFY